jgi:hypothetical protein
MIRKSSTLCSLAAAAALALIPLGGLVAPAVAQDAAPPIAGEPIIPAAEGWAVYVNPRFGMRLLYPAHALEPLPPREGQRGCLRGLEFGTALRRQPPFHPERMMHERHPTRWQGIGVGLERRQR